MVDYRGLEEKPASTSIWHHGAHGGVSMVKGGVRVGVGGNVAVTPRIGVTVRVWGVTCGGGDSGVGEIILRLDFYPQTAESFSNGGLNFLEERERERVKEKGKERG